ncbi:leucine zipper domain-containing protein [Streptomyces sp. NPDC056723]|uniref:leucine zipper domain-containing protein n=1 Tax=Streptomyces sp. NPDC056723 TaxID=3345925 RepID=UPI0036C8F2D8
MTGHPYAPLTPEGRRRLCERVDAGRPIAHVAAEAGTSRRCLAKWYARWRAHGENGLLDHSSRPHTSPDRTSEPLAELVEALRRKTKHGPARLPADLQRLHGVTVAPATVTPHPAPRCGLCAASGGRTCWLRGRSRSETTRTRPTPTTRAVWQNGRRSDAQTRRTRVPAGVEAA